MKNLFLLFTFFLLWQNTMQAQYAGGQGRGDATFMQVPTGLGGLSPTITAFTPATGAACSGTITITGTAFTGATAVSIGGTPVSSFTVISSTQITATIGSGTTGTIAVTTSAGTATSSGTFTVGTLPTWYLDADNDNYYTGGGITQCTSPGAGYKTTGLLGGGDCDDNNASVNPGAAEVCSNGIDDDCDGAVDEGCASYTYYADADGDGYGNAMVFIASASPTPPAGYVSDSSDCNDNNPSIKPGAAEVCNGVDDNCNGSIDEGLTFLTYYVDTDADGYGAGAGTSSCAAIAGSVTNNGDCNNSNPSINPGAAEVCNGVDDNCNGSIDEGLTFLTYYADADGDMYGNASMSQSTCNGAPAGYITNSGDCNDNNPSIKPGATEVCNGVDDDCDGIADDGLTFVTYYADADGDTYGNAGMSQSTCNGAPAGYITNSGDCNDNNAAVNPAATEVCNGIDDDCDGLIDENLIVAGPISGPATQCVGVVTGSATFSIAPVAGAANYTWSLPTGMNIISGQGTPSIFVSWSPTAAGTGITGNLTVTPSNSCGDGVSSTVLINIVYTAPVTPPSISGASKLCPGDVATYSISPVARAASYNWSLPAGMSITSGAGSNVITVAVSSGFTGGTLSVSAVNTCGTSPARQRTLTLNTPAAPASISGPATGLCGTNGVGYTAALVSSASSYTWTAPPGVTIVSGNGTNAITVNISNSFASGSITAQAVNGCGSSSTRSFAVSGVPGQPGTISGSVNICPGQSGVPYATSTVAGAVTYNWTVPSTATIASGQGTKSILVNWGTTPSSGMVIWVRAGNACGTGATRSLTGININAANCIVRLSETAATAGLSVYPNPASELVSIRFNGTEGADFLLTLVDPTGRVVMKERGTAARDMNQRDLAVGKLASGIYFVTLQMNGTSEQLRLMID